MAKAELKLTVHAPQFDAALTLLRKIEERTRHMATTEDVNRIMAKVTAIGEGVARIRQDVTDLKAANPALDLAALEASVDAVGADVTELDEENPAAPTV